MTRRTKIWLFGALGFLVWLVFSWLLGRLLGLSGSDYWILGVGLTLLGGAADAVLVWYFLRELRDQEGPRQPTQADEIDVTFRTAGQRLASARYAEKARLAQLPLVLCLGPTGSGKTTAILRSGLDADLLAGEVLRGDAVVATRVVNLWYSNKAVFLEAGGRLVADAGRFSRLVRHVQPSRLAAVFSAGRQAPRVALVCLSAEDLLKPGGGEQVLTHARELRARLLELSQRLGIRLPVYVVFTKADRIPYFTDFVRNFSNDEAREVLGATLPWDSGPAGTYADRTAARLNTATQRLSGALAAQRLQFLPREVQPEVIYNGYEFAREFRKLLPLATQFLVDLCKPSQLEVSPILRGFYFTGVRPVIVEEGAAAPAPQPGRRAEPLRLDATQAFVPAMYGAPQAPAPAAGPVVRKVPQWVFLGRLFRDVILKDRVALAATAGGAKVNLLRRLLLAGAATLAFICTIGLLVSFVANRRLQHQAEAAVQTLAGASLPAGDLASLETLARLDTLRQVTERLGAWQRDGAPLRLRWGLYSGSAIYPSLRAIYFARFDSLLFAQVRGALTRDLRNLPDAPNDSSDYGLSYQLLKAHLVTTAFPDKSTPDFLAPVLAREWSAGHDVSEDRTRLAQDQFAFYAAELPRGNPYPFATDTFAVAHARAFLQQFKGGEQIYQIMQSEAAKAPGVKPFDFNRAYPASGQVVVVPYTVPAAFTRAGWNFMQEAFKNTDRFFQGEEWVLGGERPSERERAELTSRLRARYRDDYTRHWRAMLAQARIAPFGNMADAARKLLLLGGNPSPLLQLVNAVSLNTAVDSQLAATVFQPALVVSPADSTKLIGEKTQPYMQAVVALGTALQNVAAAPPGQSDGPAQEARSQATAAKNAAYTIRLAFNSDPNGVGNDVVRLLADPLNRVDPMLGNIGVAGLNKAGADFCAGINRVLSKAPFNPAGPPATVSDVNGVFEKGSGAIWNFYNDQLSRYLAPQGDSYGVRPGTSVKINRRFVDFFSRAAQFSRALYPEGQPGPRVTIGFRPFTSANVPLVTLVIDGQSRMFTQTRTGEQLFNWVASEAQEAHLEAQIGGNAQRLQKSGTWAVFQLFAQATGWKTLGSRYQAQWTFKHEGRDVAVPFELNLQGAAPIFSPDWLRGLSCVGTIATP
jgi:type VI secretion system protein ImpL